MNNDKLEHKNYRLEDLVKSNDDRIDEVVIVIPQNDEKKENHKRFHRRTGSIAMSVKNNQQVDDESPSEMIERDGKEWDEEVIESLTLNHRKIKEHLYAYESYLSKLKKRSNYYFISLKTATIITSLTSMANFMSDDEYITAIVVSASFLTTILSNMNKRFANEDRIQELQDYVNRLNEIDMQITQELNYPISKRKNGSEFLLHIGTKTFNLLSRHPSIDKIELDNYIKKYKKDIA